MLYRLMICSVAAIVLLTGSVAHAISRRADVAAADYVNKQAMSPFNATVQFNNNQSGTVIASNWILGAAHIGTGSTVTAYNGSTANVVQRIVFPGDSDAGDPFDGLDFALFRIDAPLAGVSAATVHQGGGQIAGAQAVYTGSGDTGDGTTGGTGPRDLWAGTNIIDSVGYNFAGDGKGPISNIAVSDFDNPAGSGATAMEMGLTLRDSGGGLFVDFGGGYELVGVHSGVSFDPGNVIGEYGQTNFSTLFTTTVRNWINGTIPEPSSMLLLGLGGLAVLRRRMA